MRLLPLLGPVTLAALLAVTTSPASAQIVGREPAGPVMRGDPFLESTRAPSPGFARDVRNMRDRIGAARASGQISRREARLLDREARLIGALSRRYARGGLSDNERAELERRAAALRSRLGR